MYTRVLLAICILAFCFLFTQSCKGKKNKDGIVRGIIDTTSVYLFNPDSCRQITLLLNNGEGVVLDVAETDMVLNYLNTGIYDEARTNGAKIKMIAPDYSLQIDSKHREHKIVQIWLDISKIMSDAQWYTIPSDIDIKAILDKYALDQKQTAIPLKDGN